MQQHIIYFLSSCFWTWDKVKIYHPLIGKLKLSVLAQSWQKTNNEHYVESQRPSRMPKPGLL